MSLLDSFNGRDSAFHSEIEPRDGNKCKKKDFEKMLYFGDCIFKSRMDEGIRMYLSKLYFTLHSNSPVDANRLKLFYIFCKILVKIDAIATKTSENEETQRVSGGMDTEYDEGEFEIVCEFQIPNDILMNKKGEASSTETDISAISGFYQSNHANVHMTFDLFLTVSTKMDLTGQICTLKPNSEVNDLMLLFSTLILNGRFDVVEIIVNEFHDSGEHAICNQTSANWLHLLNSFIPTCNTHQVVNCVKFLCTISKCSGVLGGLCLCKFVNWAVVRSWALIRTTGAGFSIVLLFIKEMVSLISPDLSKSKLGDPVIKGCSRSCCNATICANKLELLGKFVKQYIYYITQTGNYIDIFEYMETQVCTLIYRIMKNVCKYSKKNISSCEKCLSGLIYQGSKCNICFDCNSRLATIHDLLDSFITSKTSETFKFESEGGFEEYLPIWMQLNHENMQSLIKFSKGFNCDVKMVFAQLLSMDDDDVSLLCDLILFILTYQLDCLDLYNATRKIESISSKLLIKSHSDWLKMVTKIMAHKNDITHVKCMCKEVKEALGRLLNDCDISLLISENLLIESNLCLSDIRNAVELDGLYHLVSQIVKHIDYTRHENVVNFIRRFSSKMAKYSNVDYQLLIAMFISCVYLDTEFKPVYTKLLFELNSDSKFIANFFYFIANPGAFVFKDEYNNPLSSPPDELQKFVFFKFLFSSTKCTRHQHNNCRSKNSLNLDDYDPMNAITWVLDLRTLDSQIIDSMRLQYNLLSSVISMCEWINSEKYEYIHQLFARVSALIDLFEIGRVNGFASSEFSFNFDLPNHLEGISLESLLVFITTLPYTPSLERVLARLDISQECFKSVKNHLILMSNEFDYSPSDDTTPEHIRSCLEITGFNSMNNLLNLANLGDPDVVMKLAEKMWFEHEDLKEDCIWWVTGDSVDNYSSLCDDNDVLSELKCSIVDSFTLHSYRNLFDSVFKAKNSDKSLDHFDNRCIKFLKVWSYDPEWAFVTLVNSKDWKFVVRKLLKFKPFVMNEEESLTYFFALSEKYLSCDNQTLLRHAFDFSKVLVSLGGNINRITSDSKYRKSALSSMPLEFIQHFYSGLMNLHYACDDLRGTDFQRADVADFVDMIYKEDNNIKAAKNVIYDLSLECAQVMLDNFNLEQALNPLVRMRLLLHPEKLIKKLVKLNSRLSRGANFRAQWFNLRKLLAQALELYPTRVEIHGCESIPYLHFLQALLYIIPEFDLYLLHKASIITASGRWDPVKQHLAKVTNRVSICAVNSLLEVTDDSVKRLLIWLKLPSL